MFFLLALLPTPIQEPTQVDIIEINRLVNAEGKEVLAQVILWDWRMWNGERGYHVMDWRPLQDVGALPRRTDEGWMLSWYDRKTGRYQRVLGRVFRRTYSLEDPESADRTVFPSTQRRGLR